MSNLPKFRAWHNFNGFGLKKYTVEKINGTLYFVSGDHRFPFEVPFRDGWAVEHSTDSKDMNGEEIYEGDIIKCFAKNVDNHEFELMGDVRFEDSEYVILTNDDNWPCASFTVIRDKKIIGNIHENPELLTK